MSPLDGAFYALGLLAIFLLGVGLGERKALQALLGILEREGVEPRDLPRELLGRVRHRLPAESKPSSEG